jgi:hypothetical protein
VAYQVVPLQPPVEVPADVEQVRATTPPTFFMIVKSLPVFEAATIVKVFPDAVTPTSALLLAGSPVESGSPVSPRPVLSVQLS